MSGTTPHTSDDSTTTVPGHDSDAESTAGTTGAATCGLEPSAGATIAFLNPTQTSNICPTSIAVQGRVVEVEDSWASFQICPAPGCEQCDSDSHPLGVHPLSLADHLPVEDGRCLRIEATDGIGQDSDICYWGSLTIHDASAPTAYVVATSESHPPTPVGQELIGNALPEPSQGFSCTCDGFGDVCCDQARTPPEFWAYAWGNTTVFPGERAPISVASETGMEYTFALFQAQRIPTCERHELELSWAVVAKL